MKTIIKITLILILVQLLNITTFAQAPDKMSYQAVVRDADNNLLSNTPLGMQISILLDSDIGTPVYIETHTPTSNTNGLVSLEIGNGTPVSGDFSNIDWSAGTYYIKTETDPNGGTDYSISGTSQLLSVPYALYATSSGESLPYTAGDGISIAGNQISNTSPDQTVSINGTGATTVSGSYPSFTINSTDEVNDADANPNNEIQDISLSGNNLSISSGSTVDLSTISSEGWSTTGNTGTDDATDFIGTTDSQALVFKVNNQSAARVDNSVTTTSFGYLSNGSFNGVFNSSFGNRSLRDNSTGVDNSAFGASSMKENTTGNWNTSVGSLSLMLNTTGNSNTAIGYASLIDNTSGGANTAVGSLALTNNTIGINNTGIGDGALFTNISGNDNTALGIQALFSNSTASSNVAIGRQSLYNNTKGELVAVGSEALYSNISGTKNTAIGTKALYSNSSGSKNTAVGYKALTTNSENNNSAFGYQALHYNTTGVFNVSIGSNSLLNNTTGFSNIAVGSDALISNLTGNLNVAIGDYAGQSGNYSNRIAIGAYTQNSASNQTRIGNANMLSIGGQVGWTTVSDRRFKTNINENVIGLDFILKLRPVTYFLDKKAIDSSIPGSRRENSIIEEQILQTGFIAQEVEESAHSLGYEFSGVDAPKNDDDYYGLRYAEFVVPLVKATQEQQALIEEQQIMLLNQQNEIDELRLLVDQLLKD